MEDNDFKIEEIYCNIRNIVSGEPYSPAVNALVNALSDIIILYLEESDVGAGINIMVDSVCKHIKECVKFKIEEI